MLFRTIFLVFIFKYEQNVCSQEFANIVLLQSSCSKNTFVIQIGTFRLKSMGGLQNVRSCNKNVVIEIAKVALIHKAIDFFFFHFSFKTIQLQAYQCYLVHSRLDSYLAYKS